MINRSLRLTTVLALLAALVAPAGGAEAAEPTGIGGRVLGATAPLPAATVYAYQLADQSRQRVLTDAKGNFLFAALPAGLYKIIAHKPGFVPVVVRLSRASADAYQSLEFQLAEADTAPPRSGDDFWSVQAQIPPDVLRDIRVAEITSDTRTAGIAARQPLFQAVMQLESGVDEIASSGESQVTGGRLGVEGRLGEMRLGLQGDFLQLASTSDLAAGIGSAGETSALSLEMSSGPTTRLNLTSRSDRLNGVAGLQGPVDFEQHRVSFEHALGARATSQLTAQYTTESNFHRHGTIEPAQIPEASRSWRVEGSYELALSDRSTMQTGFSYRQRDMALPTATAPGDDPTLPFLDQQVDVFGRGGLRVQPKMLMQYGLYATLRDGSVSLIPQGGVVLQLAPSWQASALASYKVDESKTDDPLYGFVPAYFADTGGCDQNEQHCYQLVLTHQKNPEEMISFGATHREYDEIERVYFDEAFFNRFESLYLVPGDRVPELQFAISRRLSPTILTRLESSIASGGGGIFRSTDQVPYENRVSYLVTSLDTRFQTTSTGLYLAFHQLRQGLESLSDPAGVAPAEVEVERLQVMVTQDLAFLHELAADWALKINMELSRGSSPYASASNEDDGIRKRLLGGIAVTF